MRARVMDCALREPFAISTGVQARAENVLVCVELQDGTRGWGEAAPFPAFNGDTQARALRCARSLAVRLEGLDASRHRPIERLLADRAESPSARAALEAAVLDAWASSRGLPLWSHFGGAGDRVRTDVSIPIVPPERAAAAARRIARLGVRALKVKVGSGPEEDAERTAAACAVLKPDSLVLDANGAFTAREALRLLRLLSKRRVRPDLFEQPTAEDDWDGLREVFRKGRVAVAADESLSSPADALRLARSGAVQVFNLKLMKCGVFGCLEIARIARAAGVDLMIGGMVESRIAMGFAAHLAAGFGGFRFADLDTPLFFAEDPARGVPIRRGGLYDLSKVRAGTGVRPAASLIE